MSKIVDLSHLAERARKDESYMSQHLPRPTRLGKGPYKTKHTAQAKLLLKQAVQIRHEQNAYSDDTYFQIPVEGVIENTEEAQENLRYLSGALNTTTGISGYGSTWKFTLNDHGVEAHCRSSIAD